MFSSFGSIWSRRSLAEYYGGSCGVELPFALDVESGVVAEDVSDAAEGIVIRSAKDFGASVLVSFVAIARTGAESRVLQ